MGLLLWIILIIAVIMFTFFKNKKILHIISVSTTTILLIISGFLTKDVITFTTVQYSTFNEIFYVDSLSIIILNIILIISFMVSIFSIGYLEEELKHKKINFKKLKLYYILMYSFLFTMVLALTVKNMGIIWIAIEATTLASTFLVGFYNDKQALEAAWKYIIICSVGIAIALLGIIFLHLSSVGVFKNPNLLEWTSLLDNAKALKSPILKLAFIFILIGIFSKHIKRNPSK